MGNVISDNCTLNTLSSLIECYDAKAYLTLNLYKVAVYVADTQLLKHSASLIRAFLYAVVSHKTTQQTRSLKVVKKSDYFGFFIGFHLL